MADWEFLAANALTAAQWAKKWWIGAKKQNFFYETGLIGSDSNNDIIVEFPDLEKNQGSKISYGQVRDLSGAAVLADGALEGNEEAPTNYDDDVTLNQKRNAVRSAGKVSEQFRSDKDVRGWALKLLERWKGALIDQDIFTAIGTACSKFLYGGDASSTATIEAGDYMTLQLISKAVAYGEKATPQIVGKSSGGERIGVCVMHTDQAFDLKLKDAAWSQAQREAMMRGKENPIFTGAMGRHDNTDLFRHTRCPIVTNWGAGTNLPGATSFYMGVGAGAIAYAKKKIWNEKTFDLNDRSLAQGCALNNEVNSGNTLNRAILN